jgi:hypothetical protein
MSITFSCPHCHHAYRVADEKAGKTARCRICGTKMAVPRPAVPPPVVEETPSGTPRYRHQLPTEPPEVVVEATPFLPQIERHIERTIGHSPQVFHEIVSTTIHVDLHVVPPSDDEPSRLHPFGASHFTVITSGVSSKPMNVPKGYKGPRFIELMMALPADWPGLLPDGTFDRQVMKEERNWWPFRWLKQAARLPAQFNTFLGLGHTIPNGEDAEPYADNTRLGCLMVCPPMLSPESFHLLINDNVTIHFMALMPLYPEEVRLKLEKGSQPLNDLFDEAGLTELVELDRPNLAVP